MTSEHDTNDPEILERNLAELLRRAHQPPQIDGDARSRILARLDERLDARVDEERAAGADSAERARPGLFSRLFGGPRRAAFAAAFAVSAAAAAGAVLMLSGGDPPSEFAPVEHANSEPAPRRVELADGSVAILRSGAAIVERSPRHIELVRGDVLFDVVKGSGPGLGRFVVEPAGRAGDRVVVLGTRFLLSAGDQGTLAAVIRGRVKLVGDNGDLELGAGEGGELVDGAPRRRPIERLSHLTSWAKAARVRAEGKDVAPIRRGNLVARFPNWGNQDYPLPIRDMTVDIHIENQVARVALDQTFFNEQAFQLEGIYQFALPAGAAISRLAMYVEGKRMEAGLAERVRARQVYESIVYRRRDPALMEWMAGNQFKVRIFPLPGRQEKRILLSYTQPLERLYDDVKLSVPLPRLDQPIGKLAIRARLTECARCEVVSTSHAIQTSVDGGDLLVTYSGSSVEAADDLLLTIRQRRDKPSVSIEKADFGHYVIARVKPALASGEPRQRARRRWVIVDDTSASREPLERAAQVHIADRLLDELDERDEVAVLAFDSTVRTMNDGAFTSVSNTDAAAVHRFLESESKDGVGATDLGAALTSAVALLDGSIEAGYEPYIIYLGDGLVTGGVRSNDKLAAIVRGKAAFIGLAVGARQDRAVLGHLAAETGGAVWGLNAGDDLDWSVFDLVAALNTERVTQLEAELVGGSAPSSPPVGSDDNKEPETAPAPEPVYLSTRQLADGEELVLVARTGETLPTAIEIRGRSGGDRWTRRIELSEATVDRGAGYLPRLWAQQRIAALVADEGGDHKDEIVALGMKHWLLSPHTSLLVLENDEAYKRFKVTRSSDSGWAAYKVPDTIAVVHEPVTASSLSKLSARAMIFREPLALFRTPSSDGFDDTLIGGLQGVAVGGGGLGISFEQNEQSRGPRPTRLVLRDAEDRRAANVPSAEPRGEAEELDADKTIAADELVVGGTGTRSQMSEGFMGKRESLRQSGRYAMAPRANKPASRRRKAKRRASTVSRGFGFGSGRGGGDYYYRNAYQSQLPVPTAMHYSTDPRFDDLTALIDGVYSGELDRERARLARQSDSGERYAVAYRARSMLRRARELAGGRRYRAGGTVVEVAESGSFRMTRTTSLGLREELHYDGDVMITHYPDLGIDLRRVIGDIEPWLLEAELPFLAPDAASLSRFYTLEAEAGGVVARPAKGSAGGVDDTDWSLLYRIDDRGRFTGVVRRGAGGGELFAVAYEGDDVLVTSGGATLRLSSQSLPVVLPPRGGAGAQGTTATVDMPLRHPALWAEAVAVAGAPRSSWAQLLASHAALGDRTAMAKVITDMLDRDLELTAAELVLGSAGALQLDDKRFAAALAGAGDHPVVAYLRAARRFRAGYRAEELDKMARGDTWLASIAAFRHALHVAQDYNSSSAFERSFKRLTDRGVAVPLRYIAAHRANQYLLYRSAKTMASIWESLDASTDDPGWSDAAAEMAATALVRAGKYEDAAARYQKLAADALDDGRLPPLDYNARNAFTSGPRGLAGWTAYWSQIRARVIASKDAALITDMLSAALANNLQHDVERLTTAALDLDPDGQVRLDLIAELLRYGRRAEAGLLFEPLWKSVADSTATDPDVYAWAADFREQQGRFMDAARHYDHHLHLIEDESSSLDQIRAELTRLLDLYGRAARLSAADREAALARVKEVAGRWRAVDPDNPMIDQMVSKVMFAVGRDAEALRYLMTTIERHSMEGTAYNTVATTLQAEGRVESAARLWEQAAEIEPDNPTWALGAARARLALGQGDVARARLDAIVGGKKSFHERFAWIVSQAETLRKQLAK